MTIRQSIAAFYAAAALTFLVLHATPVIGSAMITLERAVEPAAEFYPDLTGHAEIDDLPAYLTDGDGRADF